jgi:hypothetical protein
MYVLFIRLILFFSGIYNNKLNKTKFEQFLFYFILFYFCNSKYTKLNNGCNVYYVATHPFMHNLKFSKSGPKRR